MVTKLNVGFEIVTKWVELKYQSYLRLYRQWIFSLFFLFSSTKGHGLQREGAFAHVLLLHERGEEEGRPGLSQRRHGRGGPRRGGQEARRLPLLPGQGAAAVGRHHLLPVQLPPRRGPHEEDGRRDGRRRRHHRRSAQH